MKKGGMIENNKYKLMFLLFILFWSGIFTSIIRNSDVLSTRKDIDVQDYTNLVKIRDDLNCKLNPPENFTIILRLDDVQAYAWNSISMRIINDTLNRNMSIVLAVIPKDIEKDQYIDQFIMQKIKYNTTKLEIAQHGANHLENEYGNLSESDAYNLTKIGLDKLINTFNVYPVTFIPPNDEYNKSVPNALKRLNFKIVSAKKDEYRYHDGISYIGYTVLTKDFGADDVNNYTDIMNSCADSLNEKNICVINIHPQDYALIDGSLDSISYNQYILLLNMIKSLDIQTATFRDMIICSENNNAVNKITPKSDPYQHSLYSAFKYYDNKLKKISPII